MQDFANGWKFKVQEAGGVGGGDGWGAVPSLEEQTANANENNKVGCDADGDIDISVAEGSTVIMAGGDYEFDEDDEDMDDDDLDDYLQMMAETRAAVSSPAPAPPLFVDNTGLTNGTNG